MVKPSQVDAELQEQLRLFDASVVPTFAVGSAGGLLYANRAYKRLLISPLRRQLRAGQAPLEAVIVPPDLLRQLIARSANSGGQVGELLELTLPDPYDIEVLRPCVLQVHVQALHADEVRGGDTLDGEAPIGAAYDLWLFTLVDRTDEAQLTRKYREQRQELKDVQAQLERARLDIARTGDQLRSFSELHSNYLQATAAEFNSPLTAVLGFSQILSQSKGDTVDATDVRKFAGIIKDEALKLKETLSSVIELTALEAKAIEYKLRKVDLNALVEAAVKDFRRRVGDLRRSVTVELSEDIPSVLADHHKIAAVLSHLLNAVYLDTDVGGVLTLRTGFVERAGQKQAECRISHNGRGLSPAELNTLFVAWRRPSSPGVFDTPTQPPSQRSSLAMPICKRIIEDGHNGTLWAESGGIEQGAAYVFTLALAEDDRPADAEVEPSNPQQGPGWRNG